MNSDRLTPPRWRYYIIGLVIILVVYGLFIFIYLGKDAASLSKLFIIGEKFIKKDELDPRFFYCKDSYGYDGQFYLRIALAPFSREVYAHGIKFDNPPYRHQRILLPLLVHILTLGGNPGLVPAGFLLVNLISLCSIGIVGMAYAKETGAHPLWGISAAFLPGFVSSITHNCTEILEVALISVALWTYFKKRYWLTSLCLISAVLTKETSLVVPAGLLAGELISSRLKSTKINYVLIIPFLVFIAWHIFIYNFWGTSSFNRNSLGTLELPFAGIIQFIRKYIYFNSKYETYYFIIFSLYSVYILNSLINLKKNNILSLLYYLYLFLLIVSSSWIWIGDTFLRTSLELTFICALVGLSSQEKRCMSQRLLGIGLFLMQLFFTYMTRIWCISV